MNRKELEISIYEDCIEEGCYFDYHINGKLDGETCWGCPIYAQRLEDKVIEKDKDYLAIRQTLERADVKVKELEEQIDQCECKASQEGRDIIEDLKKIRRLIDG